MSSAAGTSAKSEPLERDELEDAAAGATDALVGFVSGLRFDALDRRGAPLRQAASHGYGRGDDRGRRRRGGHPGRGHAGVGAAGGRRGGAGSRAACRSPGRRLPGRHRRPWHRARRRLPARLGASGLRGGAGFARACAKRARPSGRALIEAMVAGYETVTAIGRACHPELRQRGFHPTGAVAVLGAAMAAGKLRGLGAPQLADALGIAASSAAGLFAFVNGGADIKRLHAGHAAREGLQAALLAEQGVAGPPACHRGARRLLAGVRVRTRAAPARRDRAAAGGAVRHHRLLHQALSVLPAYPAGRGGADRPAHGREDRDRRGDARRHRDLSHRRRACADRLGGFRQRPAQLSVPDGARARVPRHQARAFRR